MKGKTTILQYETINSLFQEQSHYFTVKEQTYCNHTRKLNSSFLGPKLLFYLAGGRRVLMAFICLSFRTMQSCPQAPVGMTSFAVIYSMNCTGPPHRMSWEEQDVSVVTECMLPNIMTRKNLY